jgi:hypothetical protein
MIPLFKPILSNSLFYHYPNSLFMLMGVFYLDSWVMS